MNKYRPGLKIRSDVPGTVDFKTFLDVYDLSQTNKDPCMMKTWYFELPYLLDIFGTKLNDVTKDILTIAYNRGIPFRFITYPSNNIGSIEEKENFLNTENGGYQGIITKTIALTLKKTNLMILATIDSYDKLDLRKFSEPLKELYKLLGNLYKDSELYESLHILQNITENKARKSLKFSDNSKIISFGFVSGTVSPFANPIGDLLVCKLFDKKLIESSNDNNLDDYATLDPNISFQISTLELARLLIEISPIGTVLTNYSLTLDQ